MRKLFQSFLVGSVLALVTTGANAIILSYTVDAGAGFGTNLVTNGALAGPLTTLTTIPQAGVLNTNISAQDFDVVNYILDTVIPSGGPLDTVNVNHSYTIRFIIGNYITLGLDPATGFGATPHVDFTQTVKYTINNVQENSADNSAVSVGFVGPTTQVLGGYPISISFKSLDVPGAPQASLTAPPGVFESVGAKTDHVSTVPEPGAVALLAAAAFPVTLFGMRRSRRS